MKVAIVYDRVNKWGGAERVLLALHEIFPDAPLYTSVYDPSGAPWAKVFSKIEFSFLQKFPFTRSNHEFFGVLMPLAFESFDFSNFDLVISVTSEAAKGIKTRPSTLHICYCLTPTRYLWSHHDQYFKDLVFKTITRPMVSYLRKWDKIAAKRPDKIIAISTEVKDRIKKYYERDSEIVFPPVSTPMIRIIGVAEKGYYLVVSRLDYGYKKVELAIEAFNKLGYPLVVIGTGREEGKLKRMAKKNIKFAGKVSEEKLTEYYRGARALIMPQEEDFGIVAVEAQAYGIPVIAYKKGGALDTVVGGKTGIFFDQQSVESLGSVVKKFDSSNYQTIKAEDCIKNAKRFSKVNFKKKLLALINKYGMQ